MGVQSHKALRYVKGKRSVCSKDNNPAFLIDVPKVVLKGELSKPAQQNGH
jgi:hypothetical protein